MSDRKGFTLIEIIVVMVIVGILACVVIPNYNLMIRQGQIKAAEYNLLTIYEAERNYFFKHGKYFVVYGYGGGGYGGITYSAMGLNNINPTLNLNITDSNFNYYCNYNVGLSCLAEYITPDNLGNIYPEVAVVQINNNPVGTCYGYDFTIPGGWPCTSTTFPPI